ncbi:MAG: DUF3526 domain-containing protein [Bacteroidota bacterium]
MYRLLTKQVLRSRSTVIVTLFVLALGIVSVLMGEQFLNKQQRAIDEAAHYQREHIQQNAQWHADDLGLLLYYLRFTFINSFDPLTALSIGQRDVNSSIQRVTIRGLEGQKYDTDLQNPANLQVGNLDLGFVIIYLFPLLIIAFTYDLLSEEKEGGTWRLVASQASSPLLYLGYKLSVRVGLVYAVWFLLWGFALLRLPLSVNINTLVFIGLSGLYLAFWLALCAWVVSWQRSSSFNALSLLSVWVILAVLLPASLNSLLANLYPVPEALSTMVEQRDGYHEKWDLEKETTMNSFFAEYPQYQKYPLPEANFSWLWYYAMQHMGDAESRQSSEAMREKIRQREQTSRVVAWFIPPLHTQLLFNDLAQSSLDNYLSFLDGTAEFHEKKRLYFYPKIFEDESVKQENWASFTPEYFAAPPEVDGTLTFAPLLLLTVGLFLFAILNARKLKALE